MYRQRRYDECIKEVKSKLKQSPNSLPLLNYQAMAYSALKKDREALMSYQKIIKKDPSLAGPYYNMGVILKRTGRVKEAMDSYKRAISLKNDYVQAYNNLGVLYKNNEKYENAIEMFTKAKEIQPDHQNSYFNLALIKKEQGLIEEALKLLLKLLDINPEHNEARYTISLIKKGKGLITEAKEYLEQILISDKKHENAFKELVTLLAEIGDFKEAIDRIRNCGQANSKNTALQAIFGLCLLTSGHFMEGWRYYEYRWKVSPGNKTTWPFQDKPVWKGERGKRVVLWKEQGIGDDILFLSLVKEVKAMCSSLSVYVDPRLASLCRRAMPEIDFVKDEEALQKIECHYHLPLGSVPGLIRNDISDFDRSVKGFFEVDPQRVEAIRDELNLAGKTVIGISWRSFNSLNKTKKSIQLRDMERIFSDLDVVLVNLQYGDVDDEIRAFKEETGIDVLQCASVDNREDLDGLAALIEACDLVVSITNVTVHMAGALAKETWVLLPYVANFWWLLERKDSVWYPSLTLYRQPVLDDWDSVYVSIREDLKKNLLEQSNKTKSIK